MISNGLVPFNEAILQNDGFSDVASGTGTIVVGFECCDYHLF